jgi:hypothetical protein
MVQIPIEAICEVAQGRPQGRLGEVLVGTEGIRYFFFCVSHF